MFGLLRLWLLVIILITGWGVFCFILTRNRKYLNYVAIAIRWSVYVCALVAIFWLLRKSFV